MLVSDLICVDQSRMIFVETLAQFRSGLTIEVKIVRHSARDARIRSVDEELHQGRRIRVDREARSDGSDPFLFFRGAYYRWTQLWPEGYWASETCMSEVTAPDGIGKAAFAGASTISTMPTGFLIPTILCVLPLV